MTSLTPLKLYGKGLPNPAKISMLLSLLSIPYEYQPIDFSGVKKPEFLAINPNGRLPAIHDPNTNFTIWESGAIMEYLVDRYDKEGKYGFVSGTEEYYCAKQWFLFQLTGQGPYFGQYIWFTKYHSEKLPSVIERYYKEINRVTGVLEGALAKQKEAFPSGDGPWLVGNKLSYVDLSFVPWQAIVSKALPKEHYDPEAYPLVKEWLGKMTAIKEVEDAMNAGH
ncbi:hypothetical protein HYFRA_00002098 [Hymenoscyphus fraxineus]|uniref:Glutathione S-transferase n=1 Tax=Hymenoscyphus fraxineus TaxID=746836 RepID=A0A9N9KJW4_9HELO|nr:hypothetical protein HYFRA_00002098 [Hymenoscyphus fraxineus]